ncbi:hypothetical protein SAP269_16080 [Spiroplasma ixodetis]|uniref:Uncharacterized protein n=1 Tax=Spiroplasma ixodetis TaxID=2141 RepID=A0ABN7BVT8_9MOLU
MLEKVIWYLNWKKNKKVETIGKIDSDGFTIKHDGSDNIFIGTNNGTIDIFRK